MERTKAALKRQESGEGGASRRTSDKPHLPALVSFSLKTVQTCCDSSCRFFDIQLELQILVAQTAGKSPLRIGQPLSLAGFEDNRFQF
jgi:hypothetical protein